MTPIEILALILIIISVIKIIFVMANPKAWMKNAMGMYKQPIAVMIVSLVLSALVLRYLLVELTIVQIFAVLLFLLLMINVTVAGFGKEITEFAEKIMKTNIFKKCWLGIIVWIVLIIWALYVLFV
ncbi:MAG: hypothetical protein KKG59_03245 [Nanoarchaeota archaeon]|nr:hypothetical protein [Nanoarchaeota archaeon]